MTLKKPFLVTTSIPYVNAIPHVGHAAEFVMADVVARYERLTKDVYFLSGTDENAMKNVQAAEKAGVPVADFVAEYSKSFSDLQGTLNISFNQFIRTATPEHFAGAQKLWMLIQEKNPDNIYQKSYEGLYCVGCEEFKVEKELVEGKCPEHFTEPEHIQEENYFFRLSHYQKPLEQLIETGALRITPEYRKNEALSFIKMGLEDFSISRSQERAKHWGVPVPGDESQIMYVWVDALSNYITALDFAEGGEQYQNFWEGEGEKVHIIGKGILRFHAIYWPALLLAAGLPLPTSIVSHEYITIDGKKVSKSLGNVINPDELVARYGIDGARFILMASLPSTRDGDISWQKMDALYGSELANGLGNLVSRIIKLAERLPLPYVPGEGGAISLQYEEYMNNRELFEALETIRERVRLSNEYMSQEEPWKLVKENPEHFKEVMEVLLSDLSLIAYSLAPFLPETAKKIEEALRTATVQPLFQRLP
jgi:methionyl-tRNA synthetase